MKTLNAKSLVIAESAECRRMNFCIVSRFNIGVRFESPVMKRRACSSCNASRRGDMQICPTSLGADVIRCDAFSRAGYSACAMRRASHRDYTGISGIARARALATVTDSRFAAPNLRVMQYVCGSRQAMRGDVAERRRHPYSRFTFRGAIACKISRRR